jgi:hypothetical protein
VGFLYISGPLCPLQGLVLAKRGPSLSAEDRSFGFLFVNLWKAWWVKSSPPPPIMVLMTINHFYGHSDDHDYGQ